MEPRQRPASVLVIAILNLVTGGCFLLLDLAGMALQASGGLSSLTKRLTPVPTKPGAPQPPNPEECYIEHIPHYLAFTYGKMSVDILVCMLMLTSGLGLVMMRSWGRSLAFIYAALSIIQKFADVFLMYAFFIPGMVECTEKLYDALGPPANAMMPMMRILLYLTPLFGLMWIVYPILVIILMMRRSTAAAFENGVAEPE